MVVYLLALGAALVFAVGTVIQQHAAAEAPPEDVMSFKLLWWLLRRRVWLAGVIIAGAGNALSATALGKGSIALVEPLLVVRLLFALPLAAAWQRCRVPGRDWLAAVLTGVGLAGFIAAGHPKASPHPFTSGGAWGVAIAIVVVVAGALGLFGRSLPPERRATLLAIGGGVLFALQDAVISSAVHLLPHFATLLTSFYPWTAAAAAIVATLYIQSAYELAPLPASFPAQVTTEPIVGIILGSLLLGGELNTSAWALAVEVVALLVMCGGIYALARSPLVAHNHQKGSGRRKKDVPVAAENV